MRKEKSWNLGPVLNVHHGKKAKGWVLVGGGNWTGEGPCVMGWGYFAANPLYDDVEYFKRRRRGGGTPEIWVQGKENLLR